MSIRSIAISARDELQYESAEARTFTTQLLSNRAILGQAAVLTFKANEEAFLGGMVYTEGREQTEPWDTF